MWRLWGNSVDRRAPRVGDGYDILGLIGSQRDLIAANQRRWDAMHFNTSRIPEFDRAAKALLAHKAQYQEIAKTVWGTPDRWWFVAIVDEREHGTGLGLCNSYLGNGQSLERVTTMVPAGRGPFLHHDTDTPLRGPFYRGALDALIDCPPHAARWKDWSPGGAITLFIMYNGLGYDNAGRVSPYGWSGSNQYTIGKITRDHGPIENVVDVQLGCGPLLRYLMGLDSSITFGKLTTAPAPQPQPKEPPVATPTITLPAGISIDTIWQILKSLLGSLPATKPAVPVIDDIFKIVADVQGGKPLGTDAGWLLVDAGNAILHANGVDPTQPRA